LGKLKARKMVDDMCFEEVSKVEIEVGKQAG
jgi:hypothetical protein